MSNLIENFNKKSLFEWNKRVLNEMTSAAVLWYADYNNHLWVVIEF